MNRGLLVLFAGVLLAGCQQAPRPYLTEDDYQGGKPNAAAPSEPNGETPGSNTTEPPESSSTTLAAPEAGTGASRTPPGMPPKDRPVVPRPTVVQPGADGWAPVSFSQAEFTNRLDRALIGLRDVAGSYDISLRNLEMEGTQAGTFVIHDATLYAIEGLTLDSPATPRRFRADGTVRSSLDAKGWSKDVPVEAPATSGPRITPDQLVNDFPLLIFSPIINRTPVWAQIVDQLKTEGFTVHMEVKDIPMQGRPRPFYRLVAKKEGKGLNTFEMRMDGIRWVPLTIRMLATGPGEKPITAEWRAQWAFNQKVEKTLREGRGFTPTQPQ